MSDDGEAYKMIISGQTDDVCKPTVVPRTIESEDPTLIYEPRVQEISGGRLEILGKKDDPSLIPWGFWGGVMLASLAVVIVFFRGASGLGSLWEMAAFTVIFVVGSILFKIGRKSSLQEGLICEVDIPRRMISWPTSFSSSLISVPFEEVEAVVYGMIGFPVNKSEKSGRMRAFQLLVRDETGRMVPIIEASTDKDRTHQVGQLLSQLLKVPIIEVGLGQDDQG